MESITPPTLNDGETWAGILLGKDGAPHQHIILLPGEFEGKWKEAGEWAKSIGGDLPTRREQSLLFANLREEFKSEWYWSCEQHESDSNLAYGQLFSLGYQHYWLKALNLRARSVRRLAI